MILINLLGFNEKIIGVNLHKIKIRTFSHYNIKCNYSHIKWRDFFKKKLKLKKHYINYLYSTK